MLIDQMRLILLSFILCFVNAKGNVREKCPRFKIKKATIIKTQQSIRDGAEFLGKIVVSSSRGCHEQCCKTGRRCNLVMLKYEVKEKVEKVSCFMFNCRSPSVCTFFQHSSYRRYAALEYEDRASSFSNHYKKNNGFKDDHETRTTTPETLQPTTATTTEENNWGHIKWFEADATTNPPKYIKPTYQGDSDDKSMDTPNNLATTNRPNEDEDFPRRVFVDNNPDFPDEPHRNGMDQEAQVDKVSTTHHSYRMGDTKTKSAPKKSGQYGHAQTLKPDKEKQTVTTKAPDQDKTHGHDKKIPSKTKKPAKGKPKATPKKTTRAATRSPVSNVVIRRLNIQENKAVIPLAVGLVLALLLLMGVIFRLKTSRRRRTKAFLTDDADYLINGMYL